MALDNHQEAQHGWQADHRRQHLPPSSSQACYDFRPDPRAVDLEAEQVEPRQPVSTPLWLVAFVLLGGPAVLFFAAVMLT